MESLNGTYKGQSMHIEKWGRFFALYENGELLCVTVYKKGSLAVLNRIQELKRLNGGEDEAERPSRDQGKAAQASQ